MATIPLKQTNTLNVAGTYSGGSLAGVSTFCDIVRGNERVSLTVTVTDESAGSFVASLTPAQTADLSLGLWESDIRFEDALDDAYNTIDFAVNVSEAISRGTS